MHIKHLKVAKKVWLLLAVVVLPMLATGLWLTSYLVKIEQDAQQQIQILEHNRQLVDALRSSVELTAGNLLSANLAQAENRPFFERRFQDSAAQAGALLKKAEVALTTEPEQAMMRQVQQVRDRLYAAMQQVQNARNTDVDMMPIVQSQLMPALQAYGVQLEQLGQWQVQLLADAQRTTQQARSNAMFKGFGALFIVLLLGFVLAVVLVRQLIEPLQRAVALANHIAQGDLTHVAQEDRADELGQLLRSLSAMSERLREVVTQVRHGVDAVSSASSEIALGSHDLSTRTEQTASSLEETAASMEELTSTLGQSAETARQANQLALTAVQAAERGAVVVEQVVSSMDRINTSSRKINDIIGVIDGIAFQTNILALNAAVEAARAGEQGRGFAVVAAEVRALAGRSAQAAKEIKHLIADSVGNVDAGSGQVAQAGQSMQEIMLSVRRVTDLMGEMNAAASEQRDGIAQVNQAVGHLDQMTQQNAALVEESSAAATSMHEQAQRLSQVVGVFQVGQGDAAVALAAPAAALPARPAAVAAPARPTAAALPLRTAPDPAQALRAPAPAALRSSAAVDQDDAWERF